MVELAKQKPDLFKSVNEFIRILFHTYCPNLVKFVTRSLNVMLSSVSVFWKDRHTLRQYLFSFRRKSNYIYAFTVKPFDIPKLKNTLLKSVYSVKLLHTSSEHYDFKPFNCTIKTSILCLNSLLQDGGPQTYASTWKSFLFYCREIGMLRK